LPAVIPNPVRAPNALNRPPTGARVSRFRVRHMISQKAAMLDFRLNLYENFKTMSHYSGGL
jgi:hypothetical protein